MIGKKGFVRALVSAGALVGAAFVFGGCTVDAGGSVSGGPPPPPTTGALTVRWSINGAFDPNACVAFDAPTIDVRALSQANGQMFEGTASCQSFSTTLSLPAGDYTANVTLLDPSGHARTTTVNLSAFSVGPGGDVTEDADFPSSSFF